jgi:mono/diheme cytochrome c family protein
LVAATGALVAAGISGCGSGGVAAVSGPAVFATHCATCHSISGSSTPRQQGGDLKSLRLPRSELLQYAAEMPVLHSRLTARELRAVVSYVQSAQQR